MIPGCPVSPRRQFVTRRRLLLGAGLAAAIPCIGQAETIQLPSATSLPEHLAAALRQGSPLVVMVSLAGCPFCKIARESYLAPMVREQNLPVVQVDMASKQPLRDFKDAGTTHGQQIEAWGIKLAPTVLFFGRGGAEVARRLVGATSSDFYGAYLEQRLASARKTLL